MKPSLEKAGELSDKQIAEAIKKAQAELKALNEAKTRAEQGNAGASGGGKGTR